MRRSLVPTLIVAIVAFVAGYYWAQPRVGSQPEPPSEMDVGPCAVTRVVDGDTIWADCGAWVAPCGKWPRIRLLNINTAERGKPGFEEATTALKGMVLGRDVYLAFEEPGAPTCGGFDRLLAYLFVDGVHVNVEMVRRGWSEFYTKYGRGRFPEEFEAAEAVAPSQPTNPLILG